tara:strand:- start:1422 stop:2003 length:582 start_codon:yes stop_codon:yes gene_type:complete
MKQLKNSPLGSIKYSIPFLLLGLMLTHCEEQTDSTFLVTDTAIGKLEKGSLIRDIALIYANDSLVKDTTALNLGNMAKKLRVYEKGGKLLLTLSPSRDSIPRVDNVRFEDPRFKTEAGININSTFKDIKNAYTIKKVLTSTNNLLILVKQTEVYFTISKEQLPSSLRYASSANIEAVQIPDNAKIKYMMLGWD